MMSGRKRPGPKPPAPTAQYILGISSSEDGSAAAMLRDGKVIFSALEPPPAYFPVEAVRAALEKASEQEGAIVGVSDLAAVAFCGKPLREFARLDTEWRAGAPGTYPYFMRTAPAAFAKRRLGLGRLESRLASASWGEKPRQLLYPEHQLSCAASAFFQSPFEDSAILVLDGPGDGAAASVALGSGEKVKLIRELADTDSPQAFSGALAAYAGFPGESSWELFTVPPAADRKRSEDIYYRMISKLAELKEDGSLRLFPEYFSYRNGMAPVLSAWEKLFGIAPRGGSPLEGPFLDFAAAAREALEELMLRLGTHAKKFTFSNNLCLSAPVELKLAAEGKLKDAGLFVNIWSQPYSAPESKAAGAALAARHVHFGVKRVFSAGSWTRPPEPEAPEEQENPVTLAGSGGISGRGRLALALRYWLFLAPASAFSRPRVKRPLAGGRSFYMLRSRLYSADDLGGPA